MSKRKYGDIASCKLCEQDIQWMGRKHGWRDRGNNRGCVPYKSRDAATRGEIITPPARAKHKPYRPE